MIGREAEEKDRYAAREINEFLAMQFGFALPVVSASQVFETAKNIIVTFSLNTFAKNLPRSGFVQRRQSAA